MYNDLLLNRMTAPVIDTDDAEINGLIQELEELDSLLSPKAQELIEDLRPLIVSGDVYDDIDEAATVGDRMADWIAVFVGSWKFIGAFLVFMGIWMGTNLYLAGRAFDPFPFILLNLTLSTVAALQAPVILMAQNRQARKDRAVANNDYQVNLKNEVEIADLHRKMDQLTDALTMQTRLVNALVEARRKELNATVRLMEGVRSSVGMGREAS